ncbi:MAG TPA: RNA polymerase sigma factor [Baekduia sp.]|uniref:RNA polymerase sigma factor n=1 Tax=Baekduia sp. TaxID=2600305 RepID=UPI002D06D01D|nr:RNA polymerase sigma factor [Baekduia sp.]HMJ36093.1 RNA polymerase sigma factor [Baekduia sp.]
MRGGFLRLGKGRSRSRFVRAREDPATFADVYVEYHQQVLRFFARRTLDPETAFDLMAETFAELFAGIDAFRGETEEQGLAWMWTIARHQLYRWRERGQVERRSLERLGVPVPSLGPIEYDRIEDLADLQRLRPQLEQALAQLGEDQRRVLCLRVVEHREYDDIARECGVSAQVIRARVSRALRQLAKSLDDPREAPSEELLT